MLWIKSNKNKNTSKSIYMRKVNNIIKCDKVYNWIEIIWCNHFIIYLLTMWYNVSQYN